MLKPIRDRVVLKLLEQKAESAGGIILPTTSLEKPYKGIVVACNEAFTMPDGSVKKSEVAVGDTVVFGITHGTEVQHNGEKFLVISEEFLLCRLS